MKKFLDLQTWKNVHSGPFRKIRAKSGTFILHSPKIFPIILSLILFIDLWLSAVQQFGRGLSSSRGEHVSSLS